MSLKSLLYLTFLMVSTQAVAQIRYAALIGPQATTASYKVNGQSQPTSFKPGVMAGLGIKIPFDNQFYFFPSFYYSLKGYKVTLNGKAFPPTETALNNNVTIHMMEIAPLFQIDLSKRPSHFFFRFGPSVDLIFAGREQFDSLSANGGIDHASRPMVFDYTEYGHYGASGNFQFGYETKTGFMIFANYEHGIGSINNADNGPTILNRVIGLTAGWFFARSKRS